MTAPRASGLWLALSALVVCGLTSCRCTNPIENIDIGVRAEPASLEFGRVLELAQATKTVTLTAETRASVTVEASATVPFSVASSIDVPGGNQVDLPVTFTAGNGEVTGTLTLTVGTLTRTIALHGVGVRPPVCTPSGPCKQSTYSLEADTCIETDAPDDTMCDPGSVCLTQGRCKSGSCLGVARSCDDNNPCTDDGCSLEHGCINSPHQCPLPANPCEVATCDPTSGCGTAPASDGTICGAVDCKLVNLCVSGTCKSLTTPEGTPCGGEIACLPEGACHNQECVRPDAGSWQPDWSTTLSGTLRDPRDLVAGSAISFVRCDVEVPVDDAGVDGGSDAGPTKACALTSYTASGFERYTRFFEDGGASLLSVSSAGVLTSNDQALELRDPIGGAVRSSTLPAAREAVVVTPDAAVFTLRDGGLWQWTDAGDVRLADVGGAVLAGAGERLWAFDADAGLLTLVQGDGDGGLVFSSVSVGVSALLTAAGAVASTSEASVWVQDDGGLQVVALADAGAREPLPRGVLQSQAERFEFSIACPAPLTSCAPGARELWLTVHDLTSGGVAWRSTFAAFGAAQLVEPAMFDLPSGTNILGGVAAGGVIRATQSDGGLLSAFVLLARDRVVATGDLVVFCPLSPNAGDVLASRFAGQSLVVTSRTADGGVLLESYPLHSLPLHVADWSAPEGVAGTRSAR